MSEGPWGGQGITESLPFSPDDIETIFEEDRIENGFLTPEAEKLLKELDTQPDSWTKVTRRVIIKPEPETSDIEILNEIGNIISDLGDRIAGITYYIFENEIGYISSVRVDERFRRRGVASEIRNQAIEDMKVNGVGIVYSFPSSRAGEELARSQGFTESDIEGFFSKSL